CLGFPVYLRSDLVAVGYTDEEIYRAERTGSLERLTTGAYCAPIVSDNRYEERFRRYQLRSVAHALRSPLAGISHLSAAAVSGLPADCGRLETVHLTAPGEGG